MLINVLWYHKWLFLFYIYIAWWNHEKCLDRVFKNFAVCTYWILSKITTFKVKLKIDSQHRTYAEVLLQGHCLPVSFVVTASAL